MGSAERIGDVDVLEAAHGHLAVKEKRRSSREMLGTELGELEKYAIPEGRDGAPLNKLSWLRAEKSRRALSKTHLRGCDALGGTDPPDRTD